MERIITRGGGGSIGAVSWLSIPPIGAFQAGSGGYGSVTSPTAANVQVAVRIRPLLDNEKMQGQQNQFIEIKN